MEAVTSIFTGGEAGEGINLGQFMHGHSGNPAGKGSQQVRRRLPRQPVPGRRRQGKNQRSPEIVVHSQSAAMSDGPFRDKHVGKLTVCTTLGAVTPQHLNQRHKRASDDLQPSSCSCPVWFRLLSLGSDAATGSSCYGLSDAYRRLTAVEDGVGVDEFAGDWQVSGVGGRRLINLNRTGHLRLQYPRWMRTPTRNYSVRTLRQAVRCPSTSG